jgi:hypothetical protein
LEPLLKGSPSPQIIQFSRAFFQPNQLRPERLATAGKVLGKAVPASVERAAKRAVEQQFEGPG